MQLNCLLASHPNCDEFQVDRMLVFVSYDPARDRSNQLIEAEARLPCLEGDIPAVERLVTTHACSDVNATVIGIRVGTDGTASYDCTFIDDEREDEFFHVARTTTGELSM